MSESSRYQRLREMRPVLERSGRLRHGISSAEAIDVAWNMLGPDYYAKLVLDQGWRPDRYEAWVAQALRDLLLSG